MQLSAGNCDDRTAIHERIRPATGAGHVWLRLRLRLRLGSTPLTRARSCAVARDDGTNTGIRTSHSARSEDVRSTKSTDDESHAGKAGASAASESSLASRSQPVALPAAKSKHTLLRVERDRMSEAGVLAALVYASIAATFSTATRSSMLISRTGRPSRRFALTKSQRPSGIQRCVPVGSERSDLGDPV